MSGANSNALKNFDPLTGTSRKSPKDTLRDLDNRPEPNHDAENAVQRKKDQDALDAANNVTGLTPKTAQFATRAQIGDQRAAAAGAQRSDNEADALGYAAPVKKRSASRQILG